MTKDARPARRVRGSRTGRPIMVLLDLMGRRMALRVLWELHQSGAPLTFRGLQAAADTNPSVLSARLGELRDASLIEKADRGYQLTELGRSFLALILPLHAWAETWAMRSVKPERARARSQG